MNIYCIAGNFAIFKQWQRDQGYRHPNAIRYISNRESLMGLEGVVLLLDKYWESDVFDYAVIESNLGRFILARPQE